MKVFSLGQRPPSDRPREKMIKNGSSVLSDAELLSVLLRNGTPGEPVTELAERILRSVSHDLTRLSKMSLHELSAFKGMGPVKAVMVLAALELGRRRRLAVASSKVKVVSSSDVADIFIPMLSDLGHEEFWVLLLNRANQVIERHQVSKGGVAGTVVDPKLIFKKALEVTASALVLCHNHPSGNRSPSEADIHLTKKIADAARLMDMQVIDHIIVAGDGYYSFSDEGRL
ncbi:MAG: RadC family protein [Bacteroidia bacterium]